MTRFYLLMVSMMVSQKKQKNNHLNTDRYKHFRFLQGHHLHLFGCLAKSLFPMHAMPQPVGHTDLFISRFSLSPPFYGGDGVTTFNLPNLHGRMPIGFGQLNTVIHNISDTGGTDKVQLTPILINWLRDTTPIYPQLNLVPHA
jgi:hypothetical protein